MVASNHGSGWKAVAAASLMILAVAGCNWYSTGPNAPRDARVQITGTGPLMIITSEAFDRLYNDSAQSTVTVLYAADTLTSSLPFDSTYAVSPADRFLVRVVTTDSVAHDMRLTVSFDGSVKYDQPATLTRSSLEYSHIF
ncbi:MAG TPA: hypothetical protein VJ957_11375 [Longimicrobiales bacterium]|nr:hypothetical protein [Longimicrobiales bacterium]